jgi:nucleoside-diphosphate-sugar epimerase
LIGSGSVSEYHPTFRTDWSTPGTAGESTSAALAGVEALDDGRVTVVWAAGTAGMTTSKQQCEQNLATMISAVGAALESAGSGGKSRVHLIGSAGAHATGRPKWAGTNAVEPSDGTRSNDVPYVWLKLAEENWVASLVDADSIVHRVSSVYSRPNDPGRSGMIAALIRNAARGEVTTIYGGWSTLRNYVHADDVGDYVARTVRYGGPATTLLADRRSYAITELVSLVSRYLRRPVPLRMAPGSNSEHHSFDPGAISSGFATRPLATAIRQILLDFGP